MIPLASFSTINRLLIDQGEVLFLRGEMAKKQADMEKTKQDFQKSIELKEQEAKERERKLVRELEALKSERDFNLRELEQATELIQRLRRQKPEALPESPRSSTTLKRPTTLPPTQSSAAKKPRLAPNIDE